MTTSFSKIANSNDGFETIEIANRDKKFDSTFDFKDYENLIWSVIHRRMKLSRVMSYEYKSIQDELFGEAGLIFINATNSFDENNSAKFSTWLYTQVDFNLRNYLNRKIDSAGNKNYLFVDIDNEEGIEISEENDTSIISSEQAKRIFELYEKSFNSWSFKKCSFLFFVAAYDETGEFNPFMEKLVFKNKDFFLEQKFDLFNPKYEKEESSTFFLDIHIFFDEYFKRDKIEYRKLQNNVRNSIRYFITNSIS